MEFFKSGPSFQDPSPGTVEALALKVDKTGTDDVRITTPGGGVVLTSPNGITKKVSLEDDGGDAFVGATAWEEED